MNQTEAIEIDRAGKQCGAARRRKEAVLPRLRGVVQRLHPDPAAGARVGAENIFRLHGVQDAEGIKAELDGGKARW